MMPIRFVALAGALVLLAGACGHTRMSKETAAGIVQASSAFKSAKLAYVSRVLAIPADGIKSSAATREGQALDLLQISAIDPVIAVLRARDQIEIEDFVSAVQSSIVLPPPSDPKPEPKPDTAKLDSARKNGSQQLFDSTAKKPPKPINQPTTSPPPVPPLAQQWVHTLRVTPRSRPEMADLTHDDGDDDEDSPRPSYGRRPVGRIPGWTLALGTREFMRVLEVADRRPMKDDIPGELSVDFLWRWRPTRAGALFDADGAEFQSLPTEVQRAVQSDSLTIDGNSTHWSRAILARTNAGWRVAKVDWGYGDDKPHEKW